MPRKKKAAKAEEIVLTIPQDVQPVQPKCVTCCDKCQRERDEKHEHKH